MQALRQKSLNFLVAAKPASKFGGPAWSVAILGKQLSTFACFAFSSWPTSLTT
jgi:hypothetical protein